MVSLKNKLQEKKETLLAQFNIAQQQKLAIT